MKAEDQYIIDEVEIWVSRNETSFVDERHLKTPEDHLYYKVDGKQTRYVICGNYGNAYLPASIYESAIRAECYFASGLIKPTRQYQRKLDHTYFRFYDDAEEVKNNIITFLQWLRKVPTLDLKKMKMKEIVERNSHFLQDVAPTQEWMTRSKRIINGKRRSDLNSLQRDLADERDLIGGAF